MLVLLASAIAVGAFPIVRQLTRRLERLQRALNRSARVISPHVSPWKATTKWRAWPGLQPCCRPD